MKLPPMTPQRKKRMTLATAIVLGVGAAAALALSALRENINLFYTPTQVVNGEAPGNHTFRLGGLVVKGSVRRDPDSLTVHFKVTDTAQEVPVVYTGILPDLFREGQGIVAQGRLREDGVFQADRVLAKHDENYMPPEVTDAIQQARDAAEQAP